ncbi:MAG: hypothetical protein A3E83_06765 [Gammaproteobacteria bacterium RIFCSPHIGHO2_12_FULL_41_20]|nr:MAG: hypothetical protein A3E83_06765 [Gammaproteobacteria bacterium RIFCSPHIGHO2_12_FULL_41_20]
MTPVSKPIVFGASGFIGQHFIKKVGLDKCLPITRTAQGCNNWIEADLLKLNSIKSALKLSATVINLAYSYQSSANENIRMAKNLAQTCLQSNISRLIHCSTAMVFGNNSSSFLDEESICYPETIYEKTKYDIERIFLEVASDKLKVCILRPTGVIGAGGQNLKKMLFKIRHGNSITNFIRSSIHGTRLLNLIPVKDVVRALLHLTEYTSISSGIFICSADDDPNNRYDKVEELMRSFLMKQPRIKSIKLPTFFLNMLLQIYRSGSGCFANRYYSAEKLFSTGFQRSISISNAISDFVGAVDNLNLVAKKEGSRQNE